MEQSEQIKLARDVRKDMPTKPQHGDDKASSIRPTSVCLNEWV
jgi:hypothetical protein